MTFNKWILQPDWSVQYIIIIFIISNNPSQLILYFFKIFMDIQPLNKLDLCDEEVITSLILYLDQYQPLTPLNLNLIHAIISYQFNPSLHRLILLVNPSESLLTFKKLFLLSRRYRNESLYEEGNGRSLPPFISFIYERIQFPVKIYQTHLSRDIFDAYYLERINQNVFDRFIQNQYIIEPTFMNVNLKTIVTFGLEGTLFEVCTRYMALCSRYCVYLNEYFRNQQFAGTIFIEKKNSLIDTIFYLINSRFRLKLNCLFVIFNRIIKHYT